MSIRQVRQVVWGSVRESVKRGGVGARDDVLFSFFEGLCEKEEEGIHRYRVEGRIGEGERWGWGYLNLRGQIGRAHV